MTLNDIRPYCLLVLLGALLFSPIGLQAQKVDLNEEFNQLLAAVDAQLVLPIEAKYKDIQPLRNRWMNYDFCIRSRKEGLEIRYKILPFEVESRKFYAPHVKAMQVMMQVATNDEEAIVSTLSLSEKSLKEDFRADWGKLFTFTPKAEFSNKQTCQLISLFREGKGMVFLFFLFNKPPMELPYRHLALTFADADL